MSCGIYKITSPKGRVYIGEAEDIDVRCKRYKYLCCKKQPKLYRSLKKYGWEAHKHEIIEECEVDELLCRERHWQDFYDVLGPMGMNCKLTQCGDKKQRMSEETKIKIASKNRGQKRSEATRKLLSEKALKRAPRTEEHKRNLGLAHRGKIMPELAKKILSEKGKGRFFSQETREKMRLSRTGKATKPIIQYDKDMNFIKEWISASAVEKELGIDSSTIGGCLAKRKHCKTAGGFKWEYKNKDECKTKK